MASLREYRSLPRTRPLRSGTEEAVLRALRSGPATLLALEQQLRLSRSALKRATQALLDAGEISRRVQVRWAAPPARGVSVWVFQSPNRGPNPSTGTNSGRT